jgi:hypothetical protein
MACLRDEILAIFDPCRPSPANHQRSYGCPSDVFYHAFGE